VILFLFSQGKLIDIHFDNSGKICGAKIQTCKLSAISLLPCDLHVGVCLRQRAKEWINFVMIKLFVQHLLL
jgi:hypothetical protein